MNGVNVWLFLLGRGGAGCKATNVKGVKSRLLTYVIRLIGTSPSGIGYRIERSEIIAKDNKYQLIDSFTLCWFYLYTLDRISIIEVRIFPIFLNSFHYIWYFGNNSVHSINWFWQSIALGNSGKAKIYWTTRKFFCIVINALTLSLKSCTPKLRIMKTWQ